MTEASEVRPQTRSLSGNDSRVARERGKGRVTKWTGGNIRERSIRPQSRVRNVKDEEAKTLSEEGERTEVPGTRARRPKPYFPGAVQVQTQLPSGSQQLQGGRASTCLLATTSSED